SDRTESVCWTYDLLTPKMRRLTPPWNATRRKSRTASGSSVVQRQIGAFRKLHPLLDLGADELLQLFRRTAHRFGALGFQLLDRLARAEDLHGLVVEPAQDRLRCSGGREQCIPQRRLVTGQRFRDGRNVGHGRQTAWSGGRERAQLAGLHLRQRREGARA